MSLAGSSEKNSLEAQVTAHVSGQEAGFSLIELLVTMAILAVLAGLATQAYALYKDNAEHSIAVALFNQMRTSLEAGKIESENFPDEIMIVDRQGPGVSDGEVEELLLPGLVMPKFTHIFLRHQPSCGDAACIEDIISVRHCLTDRIVTYSKFHQGAAVLNLNGAALVPCA